MTSTLWRHADFLKLWAAQAVSAFGSRITREGLPMAAVLTLDARPGQLGLLAALSLGPGVIIGLFAGGWADRRSRRPILIGADIARVLLLFSVPLAAWTHLLAMPQLYIVAALVGAASVVFAIADHAYLPVLLDREQLLEGNSKLGVTDSVAEMGGPALAGLLFQLFTAPVALLANAGTYLVSALFLMGIGKVETPPTAPRVRKHPLEDVAFGFSAVWRQPLIRPLLLMTVVQTLFGSFFSSLYVLFCIRTIGLSPGLLGVAIGVGGFAALLGALLVPVVIRMLGYGRAIIVTAVLSAIGALMTPLAPASLIAGAAVLILGQFVADLFGVAAMIPASTLRQAVFPPDMLGRTAAVFHVARGGFAVAGAVVGGVLGEMIGVREALLIGCLGILAGPLILVASPLRTLQALPESPSQ
ncbi:MAG: MFS transporter [Caulobacter sp.]|nr:MFS transporter [Caulobacter sp.]